MKLMLSHNQLDAAAADALITAIPALEMLRIACNRLETVPDAALRHRKLAWLAIGGNPYSQRCTEAALAKCGGSGATFLASDADVTVGEKELGRGSGAVVKRGEWDGRPVAVKLWSAAHFSDGDARGEWVAGGWQAAAPPRPHTCGVGIAVAGHGPRAPRRREALWVPLRAWAVSRATPLVEGCTSATPRQALHVALTVARAGAWLHERGLMHGDVYLHNTLRAQLGGAGGGNARARRTPPTWFACRTSGRRRPTTGRPMEASRRSSCAVWLPN